MTTIQKLNVVGIVGQHQHSVADSPYRRMASAFFRTADDLSKVTMTSGSGFQSILYVSEMPTPAGGPASKNRLGLVVVVVDAPLAEH